ncbi:MAG TPA: phosphopantetheine-binding protein, partial [Steroidobacteraceae bacterium]
MNAVAPEHSAVSFEEEGVARSVLAIVRELTAELHPGMPGVDKLGADASIERDFGLDSLARVELALRVAQVLGTAIPDTALAESETVRDLARALVGARGAAPAAVALQPRIAVERAVAPAPASPATLLDALEWHATEQPERTHILLADREDEPERISFSDLRREATSVAAGLKRRGIRP